MSFTDPIIGGESKLIRTAIQSPDYVAGVSGWSINRDGTAEFNDVSVRGSLYLNGPDSSGLAIDVGGLGPSIFFRPEAQGKLRYSGVIAANNDTTSFPSPRPYLKMSGTGFSLEPGFEVPEFFLYGETADNSVQPQFVIQNANSGGANNNVLFRVRGTGQIDTSLKTETSRMVVCNKSILNTSQGGGNTTSATYVDLPTPSSVSFTKLYGSADTKLCVSISIGGRVTAATFTVMRVAVRVDGTDYDIASLEFADIGKHQAMSGAREITGLAAGTYTVQVRYRRAAGTGTVFVDSNDWLSLTVEEVPV